MGLFFLRLEDISDEEIKKKVYVCIRQLFKNNLHLLEIGANERSIAHKLAEYLQQQFSDWHVDVEYNRHGTEIKRFSKKIVYPDIIVHLRNTDSNLLVIELKCSKRSYNSNRSYNADIEKLYYLTDPNGKFKYKLGLFLKLINGEIKEVRWFKNGQEES
jgi:hypothetical protein